MSATPTDWAADVERTVAEQERESRPPIGRPPLDHRGRQRKLYCEVCGFICYASAKPLQQHGFPICACGQPLVLANLRDRVVVEWEAIEGELAAMSPSARLATLRELNLAHLASHFWDSEQIHAAQRRRFGATGSQQRCRWEGGYCSKFTSGRYCPQHAPFARAA